MTDTKELWQQICAHLYPQIRHDQFLTWFADTAILRIDNGLVVLGVPTQFAHDWISKHYRSKILDSLQKLSQEPVREITIIVDSALSNSDDSRGVNLSAVVPKSNKKLRKVPKRQEVRVDDENVSIMFNKKYGLNKFIVGKHNRLVHAACQAVAANPGEQWNPLFIYGGVGLGKTHLLQGTGLEILRNNSDAIVVYLTAERFLNEVVDAIKKYNAHDFKARYRNVDCLIIDDIQLLADKDRTQEEFFHIFNELYNSNKQIIISSDKPPKELAGIETRLQSRFEMGMVGEVHFPDYETRLAILQNKCAENEVLLDPEVLDLIARTVSSSIRELEGVLNQAIAQMRLENMTPTVNSVSRLLDRAHNKMAPPAPNGHVELYSNVQKTASSIRNAEDVIEKVAEYFRIEKEELRGTMRKREIMMPRQICMYLIYEVLGLSYDTIGDYFSGRNHTTVLHSYNKIKSRMREDNKLVQDIYALKREMGV